MTGLAAQDDKDGSFSTLSAHAGVNLKVTYGGVGPLTEDDVSMAVSTGSHIVLYNQRCTSPQVESMMKDMLASRKLQVSGLHGTLAGLLRTIVMRSLEGLVFSVPMVLCNAGMKHYIPL